MLQKIVLVAIRCSIIIPNFDNLSINIPPILRPRMRGTVGNFLFPCFQTLDSLSLRDLGNQHSFYNEFHTTTTVLSPVYANFVAFVVPTLSKNIYETNPFTSYDFWKRKIVPRRVTSVLSPGLSDQPENLN